MGSSCGVVPESCGTSCGVATLRNWEQGRRQPEGSARVLLRVVERHPEAVLAVARDEK